MSTPDLDALVNVDPVDLLRNLTPTDRRKVARHLRAVASLPTPTRRDRERAQYWRNLAAHIDAAADDLTLWVPL